MRYEYRLDKSPKIMFRNSSLCRTWPLVWCLECADLNTSRYEDLHWLPVSQRVVFKTALMVVSICDLHWFHVPGLQLDHEVSQPTDHPHGTICHQQYDHRTCQRTPSSGTEDAPVLDCPSPLRRLHDSGAGYKYQDLLT